MFNAGQITPQSLSRKPRFAIKLRRYTTAVNKPTYKFAGVELDTASREVRSSAASIEPPPQVFKALETLVLRSGKAVSKDELADILMAIAQIFHGRGCAGTVRPMNSEGSTHMRTNRCSTILND